LRKVSDLNAGTRSKGIERGTLEFRERVNNEERDGMVELI